MKHCIIFLALIVFAASTNADYYGRNWLHPPPPVNNNPGATQRLLDQMNRRTEQWQMQQLLDIQRRRLRLDQQRLENPPSCYGTGAYRECF